MKDTISPPKILTGREYDTRDRAVKTSMLVRVNNKVIGKARVYFARKAAHDFIL